MCHIKQFFGPTSCVRGFLVVFVSKTWTPFAVVCQQVGKYVVSSNANLSSIYEIDRKYTGSYISWPFFVSFCNCFPNFCFWLYNNRFLEYPTVSKSF